MSYRGINLARRPFVNARPVVRLAILLWSVGGLLLVLNGFFYWKSLSGFEDTRGQLAAVEEEIHQEEGEVAALEDRIRGSRLDQQNEEVAFLNERIAERTFEWGRLFDRLAEVLPKGVRLFDLNPVKEQRRDRRGSLARASDGNRRVRLQILGAAETSEDLLDLLDVLFAAEMFDDPTLTQENPEANLIRFRLNVSYLPDLAAKKDGGVSVASASPEEESEETEIEEAVAEIPGGSEESSTAVVAATKEEAGSEISQETTSLGQDATTTPAPAGSRTTRAAVEQRSSSSSSSGRSQPSRRNDAEDLLERSRSRRIQERLEEERSLEQERDESTVNPRGGGSGPVPLGDTASSARRF